MLPTREFYCMTCHLAWATRVIFSNCPSAVPKVLISWKIKHCLNRLSLNCCFLVLFIPSPQAYTKILKLLPYTQKYQ